MKATGIVRRIDDLGRVVIIKEAGRTLKTTARSFLLAVVYFLYYIFSTMYST